MTASMQPAPQADVPAEERRVLMELYASTHGEHWSDHTGWGTGSPVCDWSGVFCDFLDADARRPVVVGLSLDFNHLEGTLPSSLPELHHLRSLNVWGNRLSGIFPEALLERWDRHDFELDGGGNAFSNLVVQATIEYVATGVLCSAAEDLRFRVEFDELEHRVTLQSVRCAGVQSRETYCLVREGTPPPLVRLSRGLKALGFVTFQADYDFPFTGSTHGVYLTTAAVWGDGTKRSVRTYSRQGPIEVWSAQELFLGLLPEIAWDRASRKAKCDFQK